MARGKHASSTRGNARWRLLAAVVAMLSIVGLLGVAIPMLRKESPATAAAPRCPAPVSLSTAAADLAGVTALAKAYADATAPGCPVLQVTARTAGAAPTSGLDLSWSASGTTTPGDDASWVAVSPVLLALPTEMADALTWKGPNLDTASLRSVLLGAKSWKSVGHPEWGGFTVRVPDPTSTPVGTAALAALVATAYGTGLPTSLNYGDPSEADLSVIKLEHAVPGPLPVGSPTFPTAATVDGVAAVTSAVVTTEQELLAHSESAPQVSWRGFYLSGGSAAVGLQLSAVDTASKSTLESLRVFLASTQGRAALQANGWRTPDGGAPSARESQVTPATRAVGRPLDDATATSVRTLWKGMTVRISTMALLDLSWSMTERLPGGPISKMDIVRALTQRAYVTASPRARSGIWGFQTGPGKKPRISKLIALERNDAIRDHEVHPTLAMNALNHAKPFGGTPLYQAVEEAYAYTTAHYDAGMVNQLVVMSDGIDEDSTSKVTLAHLKAFLAKTYNPAKPVRIIFVALNPKDRLPLLRAIAGITHGRAVGAATLAEVPAAVTEALFTA